MSQYLDYLGPRKMSDTSYEPPSTIATMTRRPSTPNEPATQSSFQDVHPVTSAHAAFITAVVSEPAQIATLLETTATCDLGHGNFIMGKPSSVNVRPIGSGRWLLTASIPKAYQDFNRASRTTTLDRDELSAGRDREDTVSDLYIPGRPISPRSISPRPNPVPKWPKKNSRWSTGEDLRLKQMVHHGTPWEEIYEMFHFRTPNAVKLHWLTVLAPKEYAGLDAHHLPAVH